MTDSTDNALDWEGFARDLLHQWAVGGVDGAELFEAALTNGLIREIPGGFDPEQHIDAEGICPEPGDPWYEYAFPFKRRSKPLSDPRVKALVEALRITRDRLNSANRDVFDGVWTERDFANETREADAALAAFEGGKDE